MKIKLPVNVTEFLVDLPEHGMGYQNVILELHNGHEMETTVENCEFLNLPKGIKYEEIKSIQYNKQ